MAKRYAKPTREQKEILAGHGQFPDKWLFVKKTSESYMQFYNIETKQLRQFDVYKRKKLWGEI